MSLVQSVDYNGLIGNIVVASTLERSLWAANVEGKGEAEQRIRLSEIEQIVATGD